jgi:hypothetical protein
VELSIKTIRKKLQTNGQLHTEEVNNKDNEGNILIWFKKGFIVA